MKAHETSSHVAAEEGHVLVDGPGGVSYAMSPEAAADTSDKLAKSSAQAARQQEDADKSV